MSCAEQAWAKSNDANRIADEEMEIFSIPGRLIVPKCSLCQCSNEFLWNRNSASRLGTLGWGGERKSPSTRDGLHVPASGKLPSRGHRDHLHRRGSPRPVREDRHRRRGTV